MLTNEHKCVILMLYFGIFANFQEENMKTIVCEMCESTSFAKEDGMFVCQGCGMKYSAEEAKKLMVEVDAPEMGVAPAAPKESAQSRELENLYQVARRAKNDGNSENAAKYYEQVLMRDPTSWEANFYTVYYQAMSCKIAQIESAAIRLRNSLDSTVMLVKNSGANVGDVLSEMTAQLLLISRMFYNAARNHYQGIDISIQYKYHQECLNNCCAARDILYEFGSCVEKYFGDAYGMAVCVPCWLAGIEMHKELLPEFSNEELNKNMIIGYYAMIQKYTNKYDKEKNAFERQDQEKRIKEINYKIAAKEEELKKRKSSSVWGCVAGIFPLLFGMCFVGEIPVLGLIYMLVGIALIIGGILVGRGKEEREEELEALRLEQKKLREKNSKK